VQEVFKYDELVGVLAFIQENPASPALEQQVEARLRCIIDHQRAGLSTISIITTIAPMLGILGTAWGLVDIFGVFGAPDAQDGIALGISKALYTTIFGLAIAVPGTIALSCFERALERRAARINKCFTDILANHRNA
jgi:biopolymer transport protein ExbB